VIQRSLKEAGKNRQDIGFHLDLKPKTFNHRGH
jgi:hypothetical protein